MSTTAFLDPTCLRHYRYCMPTSLGQCPNCEHGTQPEPWELEDNHHVEKEEAGRCAPRAGSGPDAAPETFHHA